MRGYKIVTHDLRSPIQGGPPLWDGTLPHTLPTVVVDTSGAECAAGWNFVATIEAGFRIAGLWPDGCPSRVFAVEAPDPVTVRGDKCRAAELTILSELAEEPIADAIHRFSAPFGEWQTEIAGEQIAWRKALSRPYRDVAAVATALGRALDARGLRWGLRLFDTAWGAWAAWEAWTAWAAGDARAVWDARAAWKAWEAWEAREAWAAWAGAAWAGAAWYARAARAVWDAWDAWAALAIWFAARQNWIAHPHDFLTVGVRDAYLHGAEIIVPVSERTLGYAMQEGVCQ